MSSFDESLRRQQAQDKADNAARQADQSRRAREADAAAALLAQMVRDFARSLDGKVKPTPVKAGHRMQKGIFKAPKSVPIFSPEGYLVYGGRSGHHGGLVERQVIITGDGRLWQSQQLTKPSKTGPRIYWAGDYVPITAETLLGGEIWIHTRVDVKDGRPYILAQDSESRDEPLEDLLARKARELLNRR